MKLVQVTCASFLRQILMQVCANFVQTCVE